MTTRIFGWSDGGSACEYYRLRVPLEHMVANDLSVSFKISSVFDMIDGHAPDVVIGQRVNQDGPTKMWQMLAEGVFGFRPRLVYEIDDDLFNVPASNGSARHFTQANIQDNIRRNMAVADVITVSTQPLAQRVMSELDWADGITVPIRVIPNALPDIAYREGGPSPQRSGGDRVTVGWAGSSSHVQDFDEVAQPLGRFLRRNPDVEFLSMGCLFPSVVKHCPPGQLGVAPWITSMAEYYQALDQFDIGIIPLRPSIFNQSKSDIKFLEYAARGILTFASNCGPYEQHSPHLVPITQPHQWQSLMQVALDKQTAWDRNSIGAAFEYATTRGVASTAEQWRSVVIP